MSPGSYPVRPGLLASLAQPGGNVTGATIMVEDMNAKRLQLLREIAPQASRVAVLWNQPGGAPQLQAEDVRMFDAFKHGDNRRCQLETLRVTG